MDIKQEALKKHYEWQGKIEITPRAHVTNSEELSLAYTPGVAEPCLAIRDDYEKSYLLTRRANMVASSRMARRSSVWAISARRRACR